MSLSMGTAAIGDNSYPLGHTIVTCSNTTINSKQQSYQYTHPTQTFKSTKSHPGFIIPIDPTQYSMCHLHLVYSHRGKWGDNAIRRHGDTGLGQKGCLCGIREDINRSGHGRGRHGNRQRGLGRVAGQGHYRGTSVHGILGVKICGFKLCQSFLFDAGLTYQMGDKEPSYDTSKGEQPEYKHKPFHSHRESLPVRPKSPTLSVTASAVLSHSNWLSLG